MTKELADYLEDYHRRRALGEAPEPEDYRETAGELYGDFARIVEAEQMLDEVLAEPVEMEFPMPFGDYTLLSELGRGAVGVVYEAVDRRLGRTVALKILKSGFDTQPTAIERFRREAKACAQVRHDQIVEIYEAGEVEGRHFYAMAVLRGATLGECELPEPRKFAESAAGIADALDALHQRGIVHRDVKPRNLVVEPSGRMVLADFGIARTVTSESLTQTGEMLGTPLYMSPEQLLGANKEVDGRTDVYCLGAALYEALSGGRLFQAENMAHLMRMILKERPKHLHEVAPDVPRALAGIVMKALEKRSKDRYATAAAMRDDLLAFARGERVVGRPVPLHTRLFRNHKRWLLPAAAVAIAVSAFFALREPAPATITLASVPPSIVSLDGSPLGGTPLEIELEPGDHTLVFSREGWLERSHSLACESGEKRIFEVVMRPADPGDREALLVLAASLDMKLENWEGISLPRSVGDGGIEVLFPRGKVRVEDAANFRFVVDSKFDGTGAVVFRVNGKELARRAVGDDWPESLDTSAPVPDEVRAALKPGVEVEWGFVPAKGTAVLARFVVAQTPAVLAELEQKLAGQDALVRDQLIAQALLDAGLPLAAHMRATRANTSTAHAICKTALDRMGLQGSKAWGELARAAR
ncbi:MAG: serine/threonine-protein kinase [Planctomycetota bacterium]|jgi:serine/threonine protein kinase